MVLDENSPLVAVAEKGRKWCETNKLVLLDTLLADGKSPTRRGRRKEGCTDCSLDHAAAAAVALPNK